MESAQRTGMNHNQPNHDDRFDRLEALIRSELGGLRAEMVSELGGVKAELGEVKGDVGGLKAAVGGLKGEMGEVTAELGEVKGDVRELKADVREVKVHVDAVYTRVDALHDQIKFVAEGHRSLTDHIVDVKKGMKRLEAGQGRLELRMLAVESRPARRVGR